MTHWILGGMGDQYVDLTTDLGMGLQGISLHLSWNRFSLNGKLSSPDDGVPSGDMVVAPAKGAFEIPHDAHHTHNVHAHLSSQE